MAQSLDAIQAGLAALSAFDIDDHGVVALGADCEALLRLVGALQLQVARRLARFDALGGPAGDGAPSLAGWLGWRGRLRPWEAKQLATTALRLSSLAEAVAAFEAGSIGFGDVATIAEGVDRAADALTEDGLAEDGLAEDALASDALASGTLTSDVLPSDGAVDVARVADASSGDGSAVSADEAAAVWTVERIARAAQPILLEAAGEVTPGQLRKAASRIALTLGGDGGERRRRRIERQSFLDHGQTMDGVGCVRADMGAADFAVFEKAIDVFAPRPDAGAPRWRNSPGHRRLRGLITACEIALRAAGRSGYRERGGAPVKVHLIAAQATADSSVPIGAAPAGRTEFGTIVPAGQVREMIRGHRAQTMTVEVRPDGSVADRYTATGEPLDWGRTKRLFTPAQRDIYLALYAGCAADGCDRPLAWSAIDHTIEWAEGGHTDLGNGRPLCDWHNLHKEHQRSRHGHRRRDRRTRSGESDPDH